MAYDEVEKPMKQLETLARCACIFLIVLSGCTRSYSFQGRVVNGDGLPIEGATFAITPHKHALPDDSNTSAVSGKDGAFHIHWSCVPGISLFKLRTKCSGYKNDVRLVRAEDSTLSIVMEKENP